MKDEEKTKEQLSTDLVELRRRIAELELSEPAGTPTREEYTQSEIEKTLILDSIDDLVAYHNTDMTVLWVNKAAAESVGSSIEQLKGCHCYEIWGDSSEPCHGCPVILAMKTRQPQSMEKETPNGKQWLIRGYPVFNKHGDITGMIEVTTDTTSRKQADKQIHELYQRESSLRKEFETEIEKRTEFTRALVHELKTPITPVLAAVELLMEEMDDQRLMRLVESINRSANNLNLRIDELLDLARGETDMLRIDMGIVDTLSLFNDVGYEMIPLALRNKQVLNFELPESLPSIEADRGRLRQVIMNLLNNAFKFTPQGGTITLRASNDDKNLIVEVEDTGPGINQEDLERLFEPYFRRTTDRERLSGLGLGLALAKNFIELHGGRIWVESEIGKGSTFHVELPIRNN